MNRKALITCNALARILTPMVDEDTTVRVLDIGLHVSPDRLRTRLLIEIAALAHRDLTILLGYGLCGRGTEGLVSTHSRLVLPRVDDCVGALLGSRARHRDVLRKCPGCYFLEPSWLDTELNIFEEITKGIDRIPADRRDQIVKMALKHYDTLALLSRNNGVSPAWRRCESYGSAYDLNLVHLSPDYSLLKRLISGPWDSSDFVVMEPGEPIPLF